MCWVSPVNRADGFQTATAQVGLWCMACGKPRRIDQPLRCISHISHAARIVNGPVTDLQTCWTELDEGPRIAGRCIRHRYVPAVADRDRSQDRAGAVP